MNKKIHNQPYQPSFKAVGLSISLAHIVSLQPQSFIRQ